MTSRERLRAVLQFQEPDRVPLCEICYWPLTVERWHKEGLPENQSPIEYFGLDPLVLGGPDCSLQLPGEIVTETDEWKLERNADGALLKVWKSHYAPPAEVDHLIKTKKDWQHYQECLAPRESRLGNLAQTFQQAAQEGHFSTFNPVEPLWWVLRTLGMERALLAIAEDPLWIENMIAAQTELGLALTRMLLAQQAKPDAIWFFADLCYRNGMFFSPQFYRQHVLPYHQRFAALCHENEMFFILHCDGDVRQFIPLLIEAGFDCIQPLEARAGNDVRELKPLYGAQIALFGNINMDVLARGDRDEIAYEVVSKVQAAKPGGGYIFHSDHSVPPTVSFSAYSLAIELARQHGEYGS